MKCGKDLLCDAPLGTWRNRQDTGNVSVQRGRDSNERSADSMNTVWYFHAVRANNLFGFAWHWQRRRTGGALSQQSAEALTHLWRCRNPEASISQGSRAHPHRSHVPDTAIPARLC